jgi:hypothetical protein
MARLAFGVLLGAGLLVLPAGGAKAVPFTTDLSISAEADFDEGFASVTGNASQSGDMSLISGGVTSTSTISGTTVTTGADPLTGALTDIGDGVGGSGTTSGLYDGSDAESQMAIDLEITVQNTSGTDTYTITFEVAFGNSVNGDGDDAFADSEFFVDNPPGTEIFFTDLVSDTVFGDEVGGIDTGTFGDPLSESGVFSFDVTVGPGGASTIDSALNNIEGGAFASGSSYSANLSAFIEIACVTNDTTGAQTPTGCVAPTPAPEPGTLTLFGTGLLGLALLSWRRRRQPAA